MPTIPDYLYWMTKCYPFGFINDCTSVKFTVKTVTVEFKQKLALCDLISNWLFNFE